MHIRVIYDDGKRDLVAPYLLNTLIVSGKIRMFLRSTGWAIVGVSPLRENNAGNYEMYRGVERRNLQESRAF